MRHLTRALAGPLLALAMVSPPAFAEEAAAKPSAPPTPVVFRITYWEVDDKTLADISGKVKLGSADIAGRRIQTQEVLGSTGVECMVALVRKNPIVYYDGKASQFQVQYVDTGVKADVKWEKELDVYLEISRISGVTKAGPESRTPAFYPHTEVLVSKVSVPSVKLGDVVLVGTSQGPWAAAQVRALDPTPKAGNILVTLELEAP